MRIRHILGISVVVIALLSVALAPIAPTAVASVERPPAPNASAQAAGHALYLPVVGRSIGPAGPGQELADAFAGRYRGTQVTLLGPFADAESINAFEASLADFEQTTGIDIRYEGSNDFPAALADRVWRQNPPDIADFAQPGLLATYARSGKVLDLGKVVDSRWLEQNYAQSWLDMATMQGLSGPITAGVWSRANAKSLVWYPKAAFDQAGYQVPQTWEQLMALTARIAADGRSPWCIGIASGSATGWVTTDWIEDMMLRTTSLQNYDRWVHGDLKFDSPEVRTAIGKVTDIWFNDAYVYGGRSSIADRSFTDVPMFSNPPECWLHRQASFVRAFFPPGKVAGQDYDFFYLPSTGSQYGKPVLVAGDIYAAFKDRPEVRAAIQYFTKGESVKGWLEAGLAVSPHADAPLAWYGDAAGRKVAELVRSATSVRFDGSDLMPDSVGSGAFWAQSTAYVRGTVDLDTALSSIDAAWPATAEPGHALKMTLLPKFLGNLVFDEAHTGAQEAAAELQNPEPLVYTGPDAEHSVAEQPNYVNQAVAAGQNAIMISNNTHDDIVPAVQAARAAGVTVVTWDSPIPSGEGEQLYVAPVDFTKTGQVMADLALDIIGPAGGKFGVLSASANAANQNSWIASMKEVLKQPKYSQLQLIDVVYGNDQYELSYNLALQLVASYPDLKLIMAPTTVGIVAAAQAMQDGGLCDRVKVSGLGLPSTMGSYVRNGCAPAFALWSFPDLGYLTYYATYLLATGEMEAAEGVQFQAGRLGTYTITKDPNRAKGLRVLMGTFTKYTKDNLQ